MIRCEEVTKRFNKNGSDVISLDRFSADIRNGEFITVRGPSGSGKTTLLLTLGGMQRPSAGKVCFDGQDLYALSNSKRANLRSSQIGFVFQMFYLVPYLDLLGNVLIASPGKPGKLDEFEPVKIAQAVKKLNLKHVVITSVDRDDLKDGGSNHFFEVISQTRKTNPNTTIEVLTPDFLRKGEAYKKVLEANPDVFNHNIETVPGLYLKVRPGSRYFASLELLKNAKKINKKVFTKSGIMVGLGENKDEILQVMDDLKTADVDFLTIGQYLQPSVKHFPLDRYYTPDEFEELGNIAKAKGFLLVSSSPLTRSSYHADEDFAKLQQKRINIH